MTKFIITTESGSDLPKELIERYNIYRSNACHNG